VGNQVGLPGRTILIIEDSPLIAANLEEILLELGCKVVGPAGTMADALQLSEQGDFDAAMVDLNIRGSKAFSLLRILAQRQIPFLLVTGYADWSMPEEWSQAPRIIPGGLLFRLSDRWRENSRKFDWVGSGRSRLAWAM
jgi:CheY-like chemotaxis protein